MTIDFTLEELADVLNVMNEPECSLIKAYEELLQELKDDEAIEILTNKVIQQMSVISNFMKKLKKAQIISDTDEHKERSVQNIRLSFGECVKIVDDQ